MPSITIKLKQHTPLIHFQYDQDGATLRASEVKPRLDKFILHTVFNDDFNKCKQYLIGYEDNEKKMSILKKKWDVGIRALDYKMKVVCHSEKVTWEMERLVNGKNKNIYFSFLGNQKAKPEQIKKLVIFNNDQKEPDVSIIISASEDKSGLLESIEKNEDVFFLTNNFGTRQTKGFGSFLPIAIPILDINDKCIKEYYRFPLSIKKDGSWESIFRELDKSLYLFYKTLRSGINLEPFYFKSLMFYYAIYKQKYYDKRIIRETYKLFTNSKTGKYSNNEDEDKGEQYEKKYCSQYNKDNARLYRDMLGLSSSQTWMKYKKIIISKESDKSDNVERFKSPILLKPIIKEIKQNEVDFIILIIPSRIPEEYFDKKFTIKKDENKDSRLPLRTPSKTEFDLEEFLRYSLEKGNEGYEMAIKQLEFKSNNQNYKKWKDDYISSIKKKEACKQKLEKEHKERDITDDVINRELIKEADESIKRSILMSKMLQGIFKGMHRTEKKQDDVVNDTSNK